MFNDNTLIPQVVRDTSDAAFARHLASCGHIECSEEDAQATVWHDLVQKAVGDNAVVSWRFKRWTKPA